MRRAGKRDAMEPYIIDALESIGVTVRRVNQEGLPDLLTHSRGRWLPIEVKSSARGILTPLQRDLHDVAAFPMVWTVEDALALFGVK